MLSLLLLLLPLLLVPLSGLPLATTGTRSLVLEEATSAAQGGSLAEVTRTATQGGSLAQTTGTATQGGSFAEATGTTAQVCSSAEATGTTAQVCSSAKASGTVTFVSAVSTAAVSVRPSLSARQRFFDSSCSTFRGQQDYISKHFRLGLSRVFVTLALKDQELHVATAEASAKHVRL